MFLYFVKFFKFEFSHKKSDRAAQIFYRKVVFSQIH